MIECLGLLTHGVGSGKASLHQFPYFGCSGLGNLQSESIFPLCIKFGVVVPFRIGNGQFHAFFILSLLFAPSIAHHVVGKLRAVESRRRRHNINQLWELVQLKIGLQCIILSVNTHRNRYGGYSHQ